MEKHRQTIIGSLILVAVFELGLAGRGALAAENRPGPVLNVEQTPINRDAKSPTSFAPIVRRVTPSVVNIYSSMTVREERNPLLEDPLLRRFFGNDSSEPQPRERRAQGLGSGVIVSTDGYILTANHVIDGADKVRVALASGDQEFEAKVVGGDAATDVAVLKIEPKTKLSAVTLTDSDKLEVGDIVLAVGNPFGVGQTVTMGIVSGLARGGFGINDYENFIQTDAAINQGNSGGALVDAEGRLVGINTAILSRTGGNMGVGFAVPINMTRYVMDRLIQEGKVTRGYLGINIQPLTPGLAKQFGLPDESGGVLIGGLAPDSPAQKAGLQKGDVIVELNGKKVSDPRGLSLSVAQNRPGTKVNMKVLHGDDRRRPVEKNITATLGELPEERMASRSRATPRRTRERNESKTDALDGVEVVDLSPATGREAQVPRDIRGALVTQVAPDSNAAEAGLRPGDVIVEIDRKPVRNADDAVKLSEAATADTILLNVWSSAGNGVGGTRYIEVNNARRKG